MKLHATFLIFITSCTLNTYGMDFNVYTIPVEITKKIFTDVALTLETSKRFRETPYILQVPKKLQTLAILRVIHKPWQQLLTIPAMLELLDISKEDLARWQCRYAGDRQRVSDQLQTFEKALQKKNDTKSLENIRAIKNSLNVSFTSTMHLLKQKILDPNMPVTMLVKEYEASDNKNIGITAISTDEKNIAVFPLLHYALRCNAHENFIELLLHAGANINCDVQDARIRTPLYMSIIYGSPGPAPVLSDTAIFLYAVGADPNQVDSCNNTLLHSLAENPLVNTTAKEELSAHYYMMLDANIDIKNEKGLTVRQIFNKTGFFVVSLGNKICSFIVKATCQKIKPQYDERHEKYLRGESPF